MKKISNSKSPYFSKINNLPLYFKPTPKQMQWADWVFHFNSSKSKLLLGARGYGKTETILFYAFVRKILEIPTTTAILITRTKERATDIMEALKEILTGLCVPGSFTKKSLRLPENKGAKNPTLKILSINSSSFKGNHVEYIFMDDPLDPADEESPTLKRRVERVYNETLNIAKKGIVVIGQPVTQGDLYEKLRQKVDVLECWHGEIPELDKDLNELRSAGVPEREIQKNYFGILLPQSHVPFYDVIIGDFALPSAGATLYAFLDPSFKGGDTTALSIGYFLNDFMVIKGFVFKASWARCLEKVVSILEKMGAKRFYYEDNGVGDALYIHLKSSIQTNINAIPYTSRGLKTSRILSMEGLISSGALRLHTQSDPDFLYQFRNYTPLNEKIHDDAPDSTASLLRISHVFN